MEVQIEVRTMKPIHKSDGCAEMGIEPEALYCTDERYVCQKEQVWKDSQTTQIFRCMKEKHGPLKVMLFRCAKGQDVFSLHNNII